MRVDGRARSKSYRLEGGEELQFELPPEPSKKIEHEDVELRIAYEDEHLLVVDKPAGVIVHPGAGHATGTLVHGLAGLAEQPLGAGMVEAHTDLAHEPPPAALDLCHGVL